MNALWSNVCVALLPAAHYHRIPRNCKKIALGTTTQRRREDSCKILSSFSPFFLLSRSGKSNDFERSKMERNQIAGCSVSRFFCTNTIFCKSKLASSMTAADNINSQDLAKKVFKKMLKTEMEGRELKIPKKSSIFHQKNIGTQKNGLMISSKGEFLIFVSKKMQSNFQSSFFTFFFFFFFFGSSGGKIQTGFSLIFDSSDSFSFSLLSLV